MRTERKQIVSVVLALAMCLSLLPAAALAAEETEAQEEPGSTVEETVPVGTEDPAAAGELEEAAPAEAPREEVLETETAVWTYDADGTVTYAVTRGNITFDPSTGTVTGCDSTVTAANIPASINGVAVTAIGDFAFEDHSSLTQVTFPSGLITIGHYAFEGCTNLTAVTLPEGLIDICYGAFENCSGLTSVTLPDSLLTIGNMAFEGCTSLMSVTLPESVRIGSCVFEHCYALTYINVADGNPNLKTYSGTLMSKDGTTLICCPPNSGDTYYSIPSGVTRIEDAAFENCTNLKEVILRNGVTDIGSMAFSGCTSLTSVTLPEGVTTIGRWGFGYCTSLNFVTIPSTVTSIGDGAFQSTAQIHFLGDAPSVTAASDSDFCSFPSDATLYYNPDASGWTTPTWNGYTTQPEDTSRVLYPVTGGNIYIDLTTGTVVGCDKTVTAAVIPSEVQDVEVAAIGDSAFNGCTSLETVNLPRWLDSIGAYAFQDCPALTDVWIPYRVTEIGEGAFSAVQSVRFSGDAPTVFDSDSDSPSFPPDAVLYYVGRKSGWTAPTWNGYTAWNMNRFPYEVIGGNLYFDMEFNEIVGCDSGVTAADIPASINGSAVTKISGTGFQNCTELTSVTLPEGLTEISDSSFSGCTGLTSVTLPKNLTTVPSYAFSGCTALTTVTLPESLTVIGGYAFFGTGLTAIMLPESLIWIGDGAFSACASLTRLQVASGNQKFTALNGVLFSKDGKTLVQYPIGRTDETYTLPAGVTVIAERAFQGCTSLKTVTLPVGLTSINEYAFVNCTGLTTVALPEGLTTIDFDAFGGCTGLTAVTLPESITTIELFAFQRCTGLTEVTLPEGLTKIRGNAFSGCTALTEVTIPSTVTEIESKAFKDIQGLKLLFLGNAPTVTANDTDERSFASDAVLTYYAGTSGWTSPTWNGYTTQVLQPPSITTQPKSVTVANGATATVKVVATGNGLTYAWWYKDTGMSAFKKGSITTATYSVEMTQARSGRQLYCVVTDKYGSTTKSKTVTISMSGPAITTQPKSVSVAAGTTATVKVVASGNSLTYAWWYKDTGMSAFKKGSITTATYSVEMTEARSGRQLYCIVTDKYGNTAKSNTVTISMSGPAITTQPKSVSVAAGATATVKVVASGNSLAYAWWYKDTGMSAFKKGSITTATYSVEMNETRNGRQLYCIVTDKYGNTAKSNTVTISMSGPTITIQPKSVSAAAGATATVKVVVSGNGLTYAWWYKDTGMNAFKKGSITTATYSVEMNETRNGRQLYCIVTDKNGNTAKSNTVTISMSCPTITTQPKSVSAAAGATATVKVVATGNGLTYAWWYKDTGMSAFKKGSITTASYSVEMTQARNGRQLYCVVTDKNGSTARSNTVTLSMKT